MRTVLPLVIFFLLTCCTGCYEPVREPFRFETGAFWVRDFSDMYPVSLTCHQNKLYCSSQEISSGEPNYLYCLDLISGRVDWRTEVGHWASSAPIITDSLIYYASYVGDLYRLDKKGNIIWEVDLQGSFSGHALNPINHNLLVETVERGCYELDARTGKIVHHWAPNTLGLPMPLVDSGRVYVAGINRDTTSVDRGDLVACMDYRSKDTVWTKEIGEGNLQQPYLYRGSLFYLLDNQLHRLDSRTGRTLWVSAPIEGTDIGSFPHLYFGAEDVLCYDGYTLTSIRLLDGQVTGSHRKEQVEKQPRFNPVKQTYTVQIPSGAAYRVHVIKDYFSRHNEPVYRLEIED